MTKQDNKILGISQTIDALTEQRRRWEEGTYAASNEELYALLGNTLDLFIKVRADVGLAKAVSSLMDTYKLTYNSSTTLSVKIVRLIFEGKEREGKLKQRAYSYARVLTVAAENSIVGDTLAKFIIEHNGIEEIRRVGKTGQSDAVKAKQNRDHAEAVLVKEEPIEAVPMNEQLQPKDGSLYSLALVRKNSDGSGSIVFGTNNPAAVNTVLSIAGKNFKQRTTIAVQEAATKQSAQFRAENVERLLGTLDDIKSPATLQPNDAHVDQHQSA